MRKIFLFAIVLVLAGCAKDKGCTPLRPEQEEPQILAFANAQGIDSLKQSNGVYYKIIEEGTGNTPTRNSTVTVLYNGKLLNGTKFDEAVTPVSFSLFRVIEGWQIGIPLVKEGGKIRLLIPSSFGYGCNAVKDNFGNEAIPANSVLDFEVTLIKVE